LTKIPQRKTLSKVPSLNIHFKQIICIFSPKKKNVELNLMFISQVNNIGNSEIPVFALIESYTESNESLKITRLCNPIVCFGLLLKQTQSYIYIRLIASSYTASFISSRGCREKQWPGMSRMCWSFFIGIVVAYIVCLWNKH
jgi:hypothetical protein